MKGIVLAGGTGSRLFPITKSVSKQLLPIFDKPMIYYPLSTLMLAGVSQILIITAPQFIQGFKDLFGDGSKLGIELTFKSQEKPNGIAEALILGEDFLEHEDCLLILGDNLFYGAGMGSDLKKIQDAKGANIFTYEVSDPENYGVIDLNLDGAPIKIEEKPTNPTSNLAVTGLYYFDKTASARAKMVKPSLRGELEITSVIASYLSEGTLSVTQLNRGITWLDSGTFSSLAEASRLIQTIQGRQGSLIGSIEEVAWRNGWITSEQLLELSHEFSNSGYGLMLQTLIKK